jgi:cellulose synthase/poly-beta-1,6-N-acetylglucosamine synthase-like glycosyltransferase
MTVLDAVNVVLLWAGGLLLLPIAALAVECLAALLSPCRRRLPSPMELRQTLARIASEGMEPAPSLALRASVTSATIVSSPPASGVTRPRTAVLIPAHDEQAVIEPTLRAILAALSAGDRLLVVADNCTDETAALARRAGADVVERSDPQRRGKGYALQYGIHALRADRPQVVVVIDADCLVEPGAIEILARLAGQTQRPVQARNLTDRRPAAGPVEAVSILANRFTNLIRPLGLARLGAPCRLTGTGMAFPWPLVAGVQLAGGSLVEDMQLGIDLALGGHMAMFSAEAGVTSGLPAAGRAFAAQRTRWEQGHLHTALRQVPRLLLAGLRRRSWPLLAMAADLSIPPLTLLVALWLAIAATSSLAWRLGGSGLPLAIVAGGGALLTVSLGLGWAVFCRRQVPLRALLAVPLYMLRKLPIYARMLVRRQSVWVRTERIAPQAVLGPLLRVDYTSDDDATRHDHAEPRDAAPRRAGAAAVLPAGRADS